jgi:hypothetical protein
MKTCETISVVTEFDGFPPSQILLFKEIILCLTGQEIGREGVGAGGGREGEFLKFVIF